MNSEHLETLETAREQYRIGKAAFERGQYRQAVQSLEKAVSLVNRNSRLGGEMQIWLVTAYEAMEQRTEAIALCEQVSRHPDLETRKQGKRLLYILKAPRLRIRPEWRTEIPDLAAIEAEGDRLGSSRYATPTQKPTRPRPKPEPEPVDLSQVNTKENSFIWVALMAIAITVASLLWLGTNGG